MWIITEERNHRFRLHLKEMGNSECSMLTFADRVLYLELRGQLVIVREDNTKTYLKHLK